MFYLKSKSRSKKLRHKPKLKWKLSLLICGGIILFLCACVPAITPSTSTSLPTSTKIVPSATFAFPTIPATVTRVPDPILSATPGPSELYADLIFEDDFSQDHGWELGEQGMGAISLQSDRLVIAIRQSHSFLYSQLTAFNVGDFYLELEIRADLCQSGDEFGLMFRVNQDFEHYRYAINCNGGARAVRILSSESRSLVPIVVPPSLLSGPKSTNRLGLMAAGNNFRFWINGLEVFETRDVTITEGTLGLFVRSGGGNQVTVSFDNLRVYELAPRPTTITTPTP